MSAVTHPPPAPGPFVEPGQRQPGRQGTQAPDIDGAEVEASVQGSVPTTMLGLRRQIDRETTGPSTHSSASANAQMNYPVRSAFDTQ